MPTLAPASLGLRASAIACPGRPEYIRRVRGGMRRRLTHDSRPGSHESHGAQDPHEYNYVLVIKHGSAGLAAIHRYIGNSGHRAASRSWPGDCR